MHENQAIVYLNKNTKCLIRLFLSAHSLRESGYTGSVVLFLQGAQAPFVQKIVDICEMTKVTVPDDTRNPLVQKASLWRYAPMRLNVYIDLDTIVLKNPEILFDSIRNKGFATTQFTNWHSNGNRIGNRIRQWKHLPQNMLDAAVSFGPAVNTGLFAFDKACTMLPEWEKMVREGEKRNMAGRLIDEIGCQIMVANTKAPVVILDETWNRSVTYGLSTDPAIVHYHGGKHLLNSQKICDVWKDYYWKMREKYPKLQDELRNFNQYDRQRNLGAYLERNRKRDRRLCRGREVSVQVPAPL